MEQPGRKIHITWYVLSDYISAILSWMILYFSRRLLLQEPVFVDGELFLNNRFWLGLLLIPAGWVVFYALTGTYHSLYKKSRLNEFSSTVLSSLIVCTILFFTIVINDPQTDYRYYYKAYFIFLFAHFGITWTGRSLLLSLARMQIRKGKIVFNSLLIGSGGIVANTFEDTVSGLRANGYQYTGYVHAKSTSDPLNIDLPCLGTSEQLEEIVDRHNIQLVVIALERNDESSAEKLVQRMSEKDVEIKIIPDILDILSGSVKTSNLFGALLIDIHTGLMPEWQMHFKRLVDIVVSVSLTDSTLSSSVVCRYPGKTRFTRSYILFSGKDGLQG